MSAPNIITPPATGGGSPVGGSGTAGTIPVWSTGTTLGDSPLTVSGTTVTATQAFTVNGTQTFNGNLVSGFNQTWTLNGGFLNIQSGLLYLDKTNGRIGIGTASPSAKLHVEGNFYLGTTSRVIYQSGAANLQLQVGSGAMIFTRADGVTESARIDSSGNVGIGYTNPTAKLQVAGGVVVGGAVTLGTTASYGTLSAESGSTFRQYTGDGTGWTWALAKRQASVTTDLMYITDSVGSLYVPGADSYFYGVRVGRGAGGNNTNTIVGAGGLAAVTSGFRCTAVGQSALASNADGNSNTAIGAQALTTNVSGTNSVAVGTFALQLATASNNIAIGHNSAANLTTGTSNIIIGTTAPAPAVGTSNMLSLGSSANWVATNGGATTYYATAGASLGYIQVYLNGANVKIQVFAP